MIAPKPTPLAEVEAVKNVTSAGKSATLLAPAPNQRVPVVRTTAAVTVVVETTALSEVEVEAEAEVVVRRPGIVNRQSSYESRFTWLGL